MSVLIRSVLLALLPWMCQAADGAPQASAGTAVSVPLVPVQDPPAVQMLVPGFVAQPLPVDLSNINFVRYRPDGRLYAGAYDGTIYLLRDTDGDGLEDQADVFWQSEDLKVITGMALTPPGYARGEGVFVATRARIMLILDTNADGRGDQIVTVAEGWPAPLNAPSGVSDSLGVAIAPDGRVFFGIGTSDYTNPYLLDERTGRPAYRVEGERGTIQEVSPDFSTRRTFATGIRFSYGLMFSPSGELFASDQEGATWLPNGNPFDELLHVQRGRHYGFPPRHPQYAPDVVDEPSTFDYGPQHQSTVGFAFDEPLRPGGAIFGPSSWRGDVLMAAMSRGRLFRTKLVRTAEGYVARTEPLAQLQSLGIDVALSPQGALVVACHSGKPDWGTGPTGRGAIWRISAVKESVARPLMTWSASPTELRVAFDAPLPAGALSRLQGNVSVTQGRHVEAGDRFTTFRPGYAIVRGQVAQPRYAVRVEGLSLADQGRTLVIRTSERSDAENYGVVLAANLGGHGAAGDVSAYDGQIDLLSDLTGVEAEWKPARASASAATKTWLPHVDLAVARAFTTASGEHDAFWKQLRGSGTLSLRGQLDLGRMLQPSIQSGSLIDWDYPPEQVTVVLSAARPFRFSLGKVEVVSKAAGQRHEASVRTASRAGTWQPFAIDVEQGRGDPQLRASWHTDLSGTPRPFPVRRFLLSYARPVEAPPLWRGNEDLPELADGSWLRGRSLYFGQSGCAVCHAMRGEGGRVGPDLSNLIDRDYDSVLRDIREPSAAINPEHVAYAVTRADGSALVAVLLGESGGVITFAQVDGQVLRIPRADISSMNQLPVSLMPPGLDQVLSATQLRDLMTFLLVPPLEPAPFPMPDPPPPRARAEIESILGAALTAPAANPKPLRVVLCASPKDAGHSSAGSHDYPLWRTRWTRLLGMAEGVTVEQADIWPTAEQWQRADVIVLNSYNPAWSLEEKGAPRIAELGKQIDDFLARGGGLVFLHYALSAGESADALAERIGLAWRVPPAKYRHGASDWLLDRANPLAAGLPDWKAPDESYWNLTGTLPHERTRVLMSIVEGGEPRPQMWMIERGAGRVFVSIPGHYTWTYDDPLYRILIFRGMMWSVREPLDRLAPLVLPGARVTGGAATSAEARAPPPEPPD